MKKTLTILALITLATQSFSQNKTLYRKDFESGYINKKYTKAQIAQDIEFMLAVTKKAHVNFYHSFTEIQLKNKVDSILNSLPDSSTIFSASLAISKIEALFNEGHLGLVSNSATEQSFQKSTHKFPYYLHSVTDSTLIIYRDLSSASKLMANDTIISINDTPAKTFINNFKQYLGGMNTWRLEKIANSFSYLMFASDALPPYKILVKRDGKLFEHITDGLIRMPSTKAPDNSAAVKEVKKEEKQTNLNYQLSIKDNNIGYINFLRMHNYKSFKDSIKTTFQDLAAKNVESLIIDLRDNGGGDSRLGEHLLSYITNKPFRLEASKKTKISSHWKRRLRLLNNPWFIKLFSYSIPGGYSSTSKMKVRKRKIAEPFFKGRVVFLIGSGTFSAANILANGIKDFKLAPLIGESTAEPSNVYSDMLDFMLPNTKLVARSSMAYYIRANGDPTDFNGIAPDYLIKPNGEDVKRRRDAVLNFAKQYLKEKR
ncbi:MAG: hypothetical protein H7Y13_05695 [Sphingobacteriaceae bacterium]|nr:hypothetical protein [Sphingobacteriaceae bacterium]